MKAGTCYDISHYCSNQFSTDVEDRLSNLRHRHHSCFLSNFDCVWSIFVCGYWNKAVFRRVARPASWEGSHRWIAPWMVGGRFTFTFSRPHSLSAAALCFICRFQFYISHGKIQNLGKILSPWIEITIGPKEGVSTCPSLKQRNVDASFKQMVLLGRKRCCLLAVICRPVDMPENFHLATYQLFYRRHWTQESIALGCTTKQGVEVGRYWLGGGANAHACIQHVLHLTHFR